MSPTAVMMSVLPRLRHSHICHRAVTLSAHYKKTMSLAGFHHSLRHYAVTFNQSRTKKHARSSNLLDHSINVGRIQKTSSSSVHTLPCKIDRYQGVHCDLGDIPEYVTAEEFDAVLEVSLTEWRNSNKCAVWLQVPISMGQVIPIAAKYGFEYHHAESDTAVLCLWMRAGVPNKLPPYATHQVGVSGVVLKEDTNEILVVRDRNRPFTLWKFPGGLADLGEDIGDTAEREIFEETGIKTEFHGILAFRQQHNHPNAFNRSDLFFVCHMIPKTFDLIPCVDEIEACQWMKVDDLEASSQTSAITQRMIKLIRIGQRRGFEHVDLTSSKFQSVYKGLAFKIYNRWLPSSEEEESKAYMHSVAQPEQLYNKKKET